MFDHSLNTGSLPDDWTTTNICAIFKKGQCTSPSNYRPVSLTSQVVKLLERVILNSILQFSNQVNLLSCDQHGFQSGCSCLTNFLECLNDWTYGFDIPGQGIDIIYTDFRKAFDSVPHKRLVHKLSKYGITGSLLRWLFISVKSSATCDKRPVFYMD